MILIAHRGLMRGPDPELENRPDQIEKALAQGFHVEVDVWCFDDRWYLGHDEPTTRVTSSFLGREGIWVHCKNAEALFHRTQDMHVFWHQEDDYTVTSRGIVWVYPGKNIPKGSASVCVLPERSVVEPVSMSTSLRSVIPPFVYGVCSDYVGLLL